MRVAAHARALEHHDDRRHVEEAEEIDRRGRNEAHPRGEQRGTGGGLRTHRDFKRRPTCDYSEAITPA
ncbi:MAG: hypothetical protein JO197_05810 [Acidobacteria bacterium]|nr:hypothetical protein [Acidobacteriota bacterium]MBV9475569.1 hypothetical protein [Acidobacteriota bacterium]